MRKEDRIAAGQQQSHPPQQAQKKPEPRQTEQVKASAPSDQPQKTQRQPGKMPLPD